MHELRVKEKMLQQARAGIGVVGDAALQEAELGRDVQRLRSHLSTKANELSVHVSCFHEESFLGKKKQIQPQQISLIRKRDDLWKRWMLNFSRAEWRLTECDGQLGIADVAVANLSYSKSVMRDDSTEHLLEMSNLAVKNLLKNQSYVDVLLPTQLRNVPLDQQRSIRIFCRHVLNSRIRYC